ncbi:primosomal protein N' [Tessaracoccus terricola]
MSQDAPALIGDPQPPRVARVAVDIPLAHLDRLFDYVVPDDMLEAAVPGARVRVRFSGQLRDGWLVGFGEPEAGMKLSKLHAVISPEPILTPELYDLLRSVADHYAGVWTDVARLAIPPRHSATEKANQREWPDPAQQAAPTVLPRFDGGEGFLGAIASGGSPRAFWQVPATSAAPGDLLGGVVEAVSATVASGRSAIVVVPTARELEQAKARLAAAFGANAVATLSADLGRSARYRNYLATVRGQARIVVGTRSAAFAPVKDLGLVVVVDDGSDSHAELRAPYPHSRTVAVLRTVQSGSALLLASHARSAEAQGFIASGWLHPIAMTPAQSRRVGPPVRIVGDDPAREPTAARLRLPSDAFRFLRDRLPQGPVLVQVPRAGHSASLSCRRCGNQALCGKCSAPLRMRSRGVTSCSLCGHQPARWECRHCHGTELRSTVAGATRTAEELARAFPGVLAVNSSAESIRSEVPDTSAIVVATPGAEPVAPHGYAGVLLLDTGLMLARPDLRVEEESLRRWLNAIALCRGPEEGGTVVAVGTSQHPALQALVRGDVGGFMERELAERTDVGLPPSAKVVRVGGDPDALNEFLDNDPFEGVDILGPTELRAGPEPEFAALLRVPLERGRNLVSRVKAAAAIRSARKEGGRLYIQVDPEVME